MIKTSIRVDGCGLMRKFKLTCPLEKHQAGPSPSNMAGARRSGHLHDYGRQVVLQDATRKETVATLDALVDAQGRLQTVPVKLFLQEGGYKFAENDVLKISASYDNPTGKLLRDGAMGIAVGYFVPVDDKAMSALRRKPKFSHNMVEMSPDH
jgi:hypothetical protein